MSSVVLYKLERNDAYWGDYGVELFHGGICSGGSKIRVTRCGPLMPPVSLPCNDSLVVNTDIIDVASWKHVVIETVSEVMVRSPNVDWTLYSNDLMGLEKYLRDANLIDIEEPDSILESADVVGRGEFVSMLHPNLCVLTPCVELETDRSCPQSDVMRLKVKNDTDGAGGAMVYYMRGVSVYVSKSALDQLFPLGIPDWFVVSERELVT